VHFNPRKTSLFSEITALVVDDDRHMCNLLKTMLHHMGVKEIRLATDAAEAFRELKVLVVDVIVCDLRMLPLDGIEFARMVRRAKDLRNNKVPIIMLTGHSDISSVREAIDAGVNDFLAKPVSINQLRTRLARVVLLTKPKPAAEPAAKGGLSPAEIELLLQD